jgi:hypothetical protein
MPDVVFIDTSVLLCVLDVPGKNSQRDAVFPKFQSHADRLDTLILPMAAIVETGNHIAQLGQGSLRRQRAAALAAVLLSSTTATAPWVVGEPKWDGALLTNLLDGVPRTAVTGIVDLAETMQIGAGDASILHEMRRYQQQVHVPSGQKVFLWTLDANLAAIAETLP